MAPNWIDISSLYFNALLLLESVQLSWFPHGVLHPELAVALRANPPVEWFMRHKCPDQNNWLDKVLAKEVKSQFLTPAEIRRAEEAVLSSINDWLVYVVEPALYDAQPFLQWDSHELTSLVDFSGKTVIDVGAGTGRLALIAAEMALTVFAVEPVANLRTYLKQNHDPSDAGKRIRYLWPGHLLDVDALPAEGSRPRASRPSHARGE